VASLVRPPSRLGPPSIVGVRHWSKLGLLSPMPDPFSPHSPKSLDEVAFSWKSICRILHWNSVTPTELAASSTLLPGTDRYISRIRIEMRLGASTVLRQDAYTATWRGSRSYSPQSITEGPAVLTSMYVQADLSRHFTCRVNRAPRWLEGRLRHAEGRLGTRLRPLRMGRGQADTKGH
jgi:hypothetical protein